MDTEMEGERERRLRQMRRERRERAGKMRSIMIFSMMAFSSIAYYGHLRLADLHVSTHILITIVFIAVVNGLFELHKKSEIKRWEETQ